MSDEANQHSLEAVLAQQIIFIDYKQKLQVILNLQVFFKDVKNTI